MSQKKKLYISLNIKREYISIVVTFTVCCKIHIDFSKEEIHICDNMVLKENEV